MTDAGAGGARDPIGAALADAIAQLRAGLDDGHNQGGGDPGAPVVVVVPSVANAALLRRALADAGPFFAVWLETPEQLLAGLPPLASHFGADDDDLRPEPPGWLRPTVRAALHDIARTDAAAQRFLRPGWLDPLVRAVRRLESEDVGRGALAPFVDDAADEGDVAAQVALLTQLLALVEKARADQGIEPAGHRWRNVDISSARATGAAAARAAIVVGDRTLSRLVFRPLTRWLAGRPRRRLRLPATAHLALLPQGLQQACGDVDDGDPQTRCVVVDVDCAPPATTVLRTPDDVREAVEVVRLVQQAVVDGTPLDRIAVIVPDAAQTAPLSRAFLRAGLPATFLVARPWRALPIAGWLQLFVDVVAGEESVATVAALLLHPCTSLIGLGQGAPDVTASVTVGRARFRTLLGRGRDVRGIARIADHLEATAVEDEPRVDDAGATQDPGRLAWRRQARSNLVLLLRRLAAVVAAARVTRGLGAHTRALVTSLLTLARKSAARARLQQALLPLVAGADVDSVESARSADGNSGAPLTPPQLAEEITVLLDGQAPLEPLVDAAVRVLAPLQALGGSFDVVIAAGVVDGRLPTAPREDPVLPDRLLVRLGLDAFVTSTTHEARERWRFAALASSARRSLVYSVPAEEHATGRPTQPSPFLPGPATHARQGSRAWPWRDDVDQPLGEGERRARGAPGADREAEHAAAVVALERDLRAGVVDVLPPSFAPPSPVTSEAFVELAEDPQSFFFRRVLLAWPAARLDPGRSLLEPRGLGVALQQALDAQQSSTTGPSAVADVALIDGAAARVRAVLEAARMHGADLDDDDIAEATAAARARASAFAASEPGFATATAAPARGALASLVVHDPPRRVVDDDPTTATSTTTTTTTTTTTNQRALVLPVLELPVGASKRLQPGHVSLVLRPGVDRMRFVEPGGRMAELPREKAQALVDDAVVRVAQVLAARRFVALSSEGRFSLDAERDRVRSAEARGARVAAGVAAGAPDADAGGDP